MKHLSLARWIACVALSMAMPLLAQSGPPPELTAADSDAIREVIKAQLDAFASDDADRAFSYAAPNIRQAFRTAENFIAMVKTGYPVVYRPASVTFLAPRIVEDEVVQAVQMSDEDGKIWIALYKMQRLSSKIWRVNGCELRRTEGSMT
jgi:DNA-binding transcriptional LysR family regulator